MPPTIAQPLPRAPQFDSSAALLRDPYGFIPKLQRDLQSDVFEARILLKRTLCVSGPDAARMFYETPALRRQGAAPEPVRATLFGKETVQSLDGDLHRQRKRFFLRLLDAQAVANIARRVSEGWEELAQNHAGRVDLYTTSQSVLARAALGWAGVPLLSDEKPKRTAELVALFDDAARGLKPHLRARRARSSTEHWLGTLIQAARHDAAPTDTGVPLAAIARYQENGRPLPRRVAAAELLNLVRPIVAVSVFIQFAVHALYAWPDARRRLHWTDAQQREAFCHEVRRYYPFFPAVVARVSESFDWHGVGFPAGARVMLDLYGTNHDPRVWNDPRTFRPERFLQADIPPYGFVPQGGGSAQVHHRCPGESLAMALMDASITQLWPRLDFDHPPADLTLDYQRLPALPNHRFQLNF